MSQPRRLTPLLALAFSISAPLGCGPGPDASGVDAAAPRDASASSDAALLDGDGARGDAHGESPRDAGPACVGCGPCEEGAELTELERTLIELPPDSWYDAPGTPMREVCVPDSAGVHGASGCGAIVAAWGGGALDTRRQRLLIWGGGHNDYYGNELYAFDLRRGRWERLTEPTPPTPGWLPQDPLYDGNPVSRHTYDGVEYAANVDVLFAQGGSRANDGSGTSITWRLDLATLTWAQGAAGGSGDLTQAAAYDPNGGQIFTRGNQQLLAYHLEEDRWERLAGFGESPLWPRYERWGDKTGAFDPTRDLFWSVGSGDILVWDATERRIVTDDWVTEGGGDYTNAEFAGIGAHRPEQLFVSGGGDVYDAPAPGFDYDPTTDSFVGWPNAGAPRILDLTTKRWSLGSADGAPTSRTSGGTYGRFRYVAAYNVFVLVTSVDEDVHFYKHTAGCGPGRG